jgi:hypothetical protein
VWIPADEFQLKELPLLQNGLVIAVMTWSW